MRVVRSTEAPTQGDDGGNGDQDTTQEAIRVVTPGPRSLVLADARRGLLETERTRSFTELAREGPFEPPWLSAWLIDPDLSTGFNMPSRSLNDRAL